MEKVKYMQEVTQWYWKVERTLYKAALAMPACDVFECKCASKTHASMGIVRMQACEATSCKHPGLVLY